MNEEIPSAIPEGGVEIEAEPSLSEHEAQFNSGPKPLEAATVAAEEADAVREHHSQQQAREKDTGQFKDGKKPRGKDAVKRIDQLTGRAKTAEERLAAAEARIAELSTARPATTNGNGHAPAPPAVHAQAEPVQKQSDRYVLPAPPFDPAPNEADPKFGGDFTKYLADVSGWNARQAVRQMEFDRYVGEQQKATKAAEDAENISFAQRMDRGKAKYQDFETVAFGPTPIRKDSIPDIFIRKDDNSEEVLYYLHHPTHRQELDELLKMPEFQQVKFLAALSQRFSSTPAGSTGTTTSVASPRTIVIPPKPPNVVRTEAQRASGGPPQDRELSLSEHEHYFGTAKRR